jgi:hypothetical protein
MSINRLFVGLTVLALVIISLSTESWAQQSSTVPFGDSITISMPAPVTLPAGTVLTIDLSITGEAEMTLTNKATGQSSTLSAPSNGGSITMEVDFDSLGLPPGSYIIEETFSGTVVWTIPFISIEPFYPIAEFEGWEAYIPAGATIVLKFTASGCFSVSGDFTGETGYLDPLPANIWGLPITLQRDIKGPVPGPADIIEFGFSLDGTLTKTTEIIYTPGDVSGNGEVTAYDASLVLQYVVGLIELSPEQQKAADITNNGAISALDAALILQYTVGLITKFPVDSVPVAPALNPKNEIKLLIEVIEQLDTTLLTREQKQVLEQLKNLVFSQLIPKHTVLLQNFPNPFNPDTWVPFQLSKDAEVTIRIYNLKGQLIRTLYFGNQPAGSYLTKNRAAYWNGRTQTGEAASSGVYFYTIQASNFTATRKMILLK